VIVAVVTMSLFNTAVITVIAKIYARAPQECPRGSSSSSDSKENEVNVLCAEKEMCCINSNPHAGVGWYQNKDVRGVCVSRKGTDGYEKHDNYCPNSVYSYRYKPGENKKAPLSGVENKDRKRNVDFVCSAVARVDVL